MDSVFSTPELLEAMDRVFSKPELLEAILLQLPPRDLLLNAQRVNRYFKETIASSPLLQQAIFFVPTPADSRIVPRFNPLLEAAFPPWFEGGRYSHNNISDEIFKNLPWAKDDETAAAFARKGASWRRMLVTQPPTTTLYILRRIRARMGHSDAIEQHFFRQGLRMGTLYDLVQHHCESSPVCSFSMFWQMSPIDIMDATGDSRAYIRHEHSRNRREFRKDMEASRVDKGKGITLLLEEVSQCIKGGTGCLDAKFRSLGYGSEEATSQQTFLSPDSP